MGILIHAEPSKIVLENSLKGMKNQIGIVEDYGIFCTYKNAHQNNVFRLTMIRVRTVNCVTVIALVCTIIVCLG
jgi:hypothetical protein